MAIASGIEHDGPRVELAGDRVEAAGLQELDDRVDHECATTSRDGE